MDFNIALQNQLTARQKRADERNGVERIYSRKQIEQAFLETFDLIGGIPRLAIWANNEENYGQFLALLMRMAPKEMRGVAQGAILEYRTNVPPSPLNRPKETEVAEDAEFTEPEPRG
jgi:hypothetical protein